MLRPKDIKNRYLRRAYMTGVMIAITPVLCGVVIADAVGRMVAGLGETARETKTLCREVRIDFCEMWKV